MPAASAPSGVVCLSCVGKREVREAWACSSLHRGMAVLRASTDLISDSPARLFTVCRCSWSVQEAWSYQQEGLQYATYPQLEEFIFMHLRPEASRREKSTETHVPTMHNLRQGLLHARA